MNAKLKPVLLILGSLAALLIVSQLVMGLLIVRGGGSIDLTKLIKAHQHSGYLTVTVVLPTSACRSRRSPRLPARPKG